MRIARIIISGNGNAEIAVTENLNVVIAGNGTISFKGDPDITSLYRVMGALKMPIRIK